MARRFITLLFFALASAAMTWPMAFSADRVLINGNTDTLDALYNLWWFKYSIFSLHISPWDSPLMNYPEGYSTLLLPMYITYGIISLPVQFLLSDPHSLAYPRELTIAFNMLTVLSFALSGFFMYLFVRHLTGSGRAGIISGLIFSFLPYHQWSISRCHVSCIELLILCIYFYWRAVHEQKPKHAVGLGIALLLLVYMSPPYMVYLFLFMVLHLIYLLFTERKKVIGTAFIRQIGIAALVFLPLFMPMLLRLAHDLKHPVAPLYQPLGEKVAFSGNLLAYFIPSPDQDAYQPLMGHLPEVDPDFKRGHGIGSYELFMGYGPLLLVLFTLLRFRPRGSGFWALAGACFFILSLGPYLHLGAHTYRGFPMPYGILHDFMPLFRLDRTPVRNFVITTVCFAVIAGYGVKALEEKVAPGRMNLLFFLLCAAVLLEYAEAPFKLRAFPIPPYYREMAQDKRCYCVLDLPDSPDMTMLSGSYHILHKKPLMLPLSGRISDPVFLAHPLYKYLDHPELYWSLSDMEREKAAAEMKKELRRRDIGRITLFTRFLSGERLNQLTRILRRLDPVDESVRDNGLFVAFSFPYECTPERKKLFFPAAADGVIYESPSQGQNSTLQKHKVKNQSP